jgi:hypothetical protein
VTTAYIDGELCGVRADGVTSFELMQQSADAGYGGLIHFAFDLIELDGENVARLPLLERNESRIDRPVDTRGHRPSLRLPATRQLPIELSKLHRAKR